jgi:hypothetical protein
VRKPMRHRWLMRAGGGSYSCVLDKSIHANIRAGLPENRRWGLHGSPTTSDSSHHRPNRR